MAKTVYRIPVGELAANCYLLVDEDSKKAIVIDPGAEAEKILSFIKEKEWKVELIINTHGHWDHVGANAAVKKATGAPVAIYETEAAMLHDKSNLSSLFQDKGDGGEADILLKDGQMLPFAGGTVKVLHTPGHTPGGICLLYDKLLFSGDTLFQASVGRTDFSNGSFEDLVDGIEKKLLVLDDDVIVYPGHGPQTYIGFEKSYNPYLRKPQK